MRYNPQEIEEKWQKNWEKEKFYQAQDFSKETKKYILIEFPYPSGAGLHVGHVRSYTAMDVVSRKLRMDGFNVLFPIGWDAFGLPAENYALKTGIHPRKATEDNISNFRKQLKSLGLSFDWSREIDTTDPEYYKWTQWIFLKLFEKGLAYQAEMPINWCPSCKIGLANEEVIDNKCERCGTQTEKKVLKQWMLKITEYADRLIDDLGKVDYLEKIKTQQINWIGKSFGAEIDFKVTGLNKTIKVFTTRADTLFGVKAVVLAPENPLCQKLITSENKSKAEKYISDSKKKSDFEREKLEKEKTGVFTGSYCINPVNDEKVPVWIGDYVIASYGGGAVMVVPAHDYRDFDFAKKYGLVIKCVVLPRGRWIQYPTPAEKISEIEIKNIETEEAFVDYGYLIRSDQFDGLKSEQAIEKIVEWLEKKGLARKTIKYKLRDWVFSRQHYWGEPIPIIHCPKCGAVPVPEKDLPVELPFLEKYQPTGTGESPLKSAEKWLKVKCPKCKGPAQRETDTMPNWAGSNWYFLRYLDHKNDKALAERKKIDYWMPVDWYNGGMEHTTLHLLYSRFIYKFLFDIKVVPQLEPYQKRTAVGIVLAGDGRKMSKSFGNIVNPDDIVKDYGADTLRLYEMFMGPFDQSIAWNEQGVKGMRRFLERVWNLVEECKKNKQNSESLIRALNKLNKKIGKDLEEMKFNTSVAAFMEFLNSASDDKQNLSKDALEYFLILFSPFAPHICEELWKELGHKKSITLEKWPQYDPKLIKEDFISLVIQVNGRVKGSVEAKADITQAEAEELAISQEKIKNWVEGKEIKKVIFVPGKLINIVI
jgi:leucyl-tRNA synthetase